MKICLSKLKIAPVLAKFACLNLAAEFFDVELLKFEPVIYLS